ncbi:MAG: hypothetical protein LLG37_03675 [Spirochaetia bacterium]|nr:hypothetical protein [Spirochaetia bacterium]
MNKPVYFWSINTKPKYENVLYRMGYKKGITIMSRADEQLVKNGINSAETLCSLKGALIQVEIAGIDGTSVTLENGFIIRSADIAKLFTDCTHAAIMAATAGAAVVEAVRKETSGGNAALGVVMDAYASEAVDAALDWVNEFVKTQLQKKSMKTTRRFSPGYGDMKPEYQSDFYKMLGLENIGITITRRSLLIPEKSVIGICGIM